jgi:putative transposase
LNEALFSTLSSARAALAAWKEDYNVNRPHSGLGNLTPNACAARSTLALEAA